VSRGRCSAGNQSPNTHCTLLLQRFITAAVVVIIVTVIIIGSPSSPPPPPTTHHPPPSSHHLPPQALIAFDPRLLGINVTLDVYFDDEGEGVEVCVKYLKVLRVQGGVWGLASLVTRRCV
jgi:hypothetical protein